MKYIIAIGIFQALVAIALLIKSKLKSGADGMLILLVACIATHLLMKFVIFNFIGDAHVRFQMNTFVGFCYGPLLYLYARKLKDPSFIPSSKWFVFIPFVIASIAYFSVVSVLVVAPHAAYTMLDYYNNITFYTLLPSNVFYAYLALKMTRRISILQYKEIKLANQIAYAFILMSVIGTGFAIFNSTNYQMNILVRSVCYSIFLFICVVILRYRFLMIQNNAIQNVMPLDIKEITKSIVNDVAPELTIDNTVEAAEMKKSIRSTEEHANVWLQLEVQMKTTKAFTDGTLNLDKLAELTAINKHHISETLNNYSNKSFYQYINEYRIQFAIDQMKYLVEKEISVNILSLAYDSGFNAKSSFNRYFKEITHQTPSEYLKALQGNHAVSYFNSAMG